MLMRLWLISQSLLRRFDMDTVTIHFQLSREEVTVIEQCLMAEQARLCEMMSKHALVGDMEGVRSCMEAFDITTRVVRTLTPMH